MTPTSFFVSVREGGTEPKRQRSMNKSVDHSMTVLEKTALLSLNGGRRASGNPCSGIVVSCTDNYSAIKNVVLLQKKSTEEALR